MSHRLRGWRKAWAYVVTWVSTRLHLSTEDLVDQLALPPSDPPSMERWARQIAGYVVRMYADVPDRLVPFDPEALPASCRRWYDAQRESLAELGFVPLADVESTWVTSIQGPPILQRLGLSVDRNTLAIAWRIDHFTRIEQGVSLQSELDDGRVLCTNADSPGNFTAPASIENLYLPAGTAPSELWRIHRERLAGAVVRALPDLDAVHAMWDRIRVRKRDAARDRGWVDENELRSLLGEHYDDTLAATFRAELAALR